MSGMRRTLLAAAAPPGRATVAHGLEMCPDALLLQDVPQVCKKLGEGREKGS